MQIKREREGGGGRGEGVVWLLHSASGSRHVLTDRSRSADAAEKLSFC